MCQLVVMYFNYVVLLVLGHIIADKATFKWGQRAGGEGSCGVGSWGCQCVQVCGPHDFPPSQGGRGPGGGQRDGEGEVARMAASSARCPWQGCAPSLVPRAAGAIQGNGQERKAGCGAG